MLHINMMVCPCYPFEKLPSLTPSKSKTITTLLAALLILLSTINPTAAAPLANTNQLPNLNTTAVIIPSDPDAITIASTSFGAAIDLCRDTYYGDCFLNVIVPDLQCYFLNPNYFSGTSPSPNTSLLYFRLILAMHRQMC